MREAANLYYSRLKVNPNQTGAKADMIYLIREARHMGIALGMDTLKYTSIDLDVRAVVDYMLFKSQGVLGFPSDLKWLYGFIEPHVTRKMSPENFIILTRGGSLGLGVFPDLPWHKREKENILKAVGIEVSHGEEIEYGQSRGIYQTVGDPEHSEIISQYIEKKIGMGKLGKAMGRSSRTIQLQIHQHDDEIKVKGFCSVCRRAGSPHLSDEARRL